MAAPPAAGTVSTAATSVVAASSQANAASSQAAAATTQAAASTQAAVASSAAAAPNNAVSASTIVAAASSAVNASSSASAVSVSASSASVSASASSSAAVSSSAIGASSSSVSRISSSAQSNASAAAASASTVASRKNGLSAGAIGGIVGGVVGGLAVLALVWFLWRRRRDKKDWVPPPPPREMSYNPQSMSRQRAMSNANMGGAGINRASSYSTLLHPRPPSTNQSHSRSPSYYASYPIATPSSMSHDNSPPLHMASNTGTSSTESSPPLSGLNTPAVKPALAPIDTSLQRDSSGSSDGRPFPRHKSSVDRLRQDAQVGFSRTGSVSSGHERNPSEGSSRATSPHPSMTGNSHRNSFSSSLTPVNHPRPYSSYSLTSQATGPQRVGGAPHQRYMNVTMPRLLGARPDENGDFFPGMPRSHESMHWNAKQDLQDFTPPSPVHTKRPSTLSMSSLPHPRHDASNGV